MLLDPTGTSVFDEIDHLCKALIAAVVGVGHMVDAVMSAEVGESTDFFRMNALRIELADVAFVFLVHHQDPIEILQILRADGSCCAKNAIALCRQMSPHAGIGGISLVVADGASGVVLDLSF